jgi:type I restriction enzyme S subunit
MMSTIKLSNFVEFNPSERLSKGTIATKVSMDNLGVHTRKIQGFSTEEFSGGTKFRNGDTLLARITPCLENGKTAFVNVLADGEVAFGSTEYIVLRAKDGISIPQFVYYLAISKSVREHAIKSMVGTSGRQRVQQQALENLEIPHYPLPLQSHIVDTITLFVAV